MKFSFKKIAAVVIAAIGLSTAAAGIAGCSAKKTVSDAPTNVDITKAPAPTDGSLPTAHTGLENLSYIAYVFDAQEQYHSYSYTVTEASIATQVTRGWRDYKDGVLISSDVTYSSMVKSGTQVCYVYNEETEEYEAYMRESATPSSDTTNLSADWSSDAPVYYTKQAYMYTYGLFQTELTNFIINEETVTESGEVQDNGNGTYTQSFVLDPTASTYYYQYGMKTRGGLNGYPTFKTVNLTVTFDSSWRILQVVTRDISDVNKGVVVESVSDSTTDYSYGSDGFDNEHFAYYNNYYGQYLGDDTLVKGGDVEEEFVVDVTSCLSNGFSRIMNGGQQFEITAQIGKNTYKGYAFVSLDLADPLGTLAIKLSLGQTLDKQDLYFEYKNGEGTAYYGDNFALGVNLATTKAAIAEFEKWADNLSASLNEAKGNTSSSSTTSASSESSTSEDSDLLSGLMSQMTLSEGTTQKTLTLKTDDLLGTGIGIDVNLIFGIGDRTITFRGGNIGGVSVGGQELDLSVKIKTTSAAEISRDESRTTADLADYINDVHSLLASDLIKVNLDLTGGNDVVVSALKDVSANVEAYVDIDGVTAQATANVSYTYNGTKLSAKMGVWYDYQPAEGGYGDILLTLSDVYVGDEKMNVDVSAVSSVDELASSVRTLLGYCNVSLSNDGFGNAELADILTSALSVKFASLLGEVVLNDDELAVDVNVDKVLTMVGVNAGVKFGSCSLAYAKGVNGNNGGVLSASLPAIGFSLSVCGADGVLDVPDTENSLNLAYTVDDIASLLSAKSYTISLALNGNAEGVKISQLANVGADISVNVSKDLKAVSADINSVSYTYKDEDGKTKTVSASLSAYYYTDENDDEQVYIRLNKVNNTTLNAVVKCDVDDTVTAVRELLSTAGVNTDSLKGVELSGNIDGTTLANVVGELITDLPSIVTEITVNNKGAKVGVNVDEVLSLFDVNAGVELGTVELAYVQNPESGEKLSASIPAVGLSVSVAGNESDISITKAPTDCPELSDLVSVVNGVWSEINNVINDKAVTFEFDEDKTYLKTDGLTVALSGAGEVSWQKDNGYVALNFEFSLTEKGTDTTTFKLLYNAKGNEEGAEVPLVRLAINNVGLDIYKDDVDGVKDGIETIKEAISTLLGSDEEESGSDLTETLSNALNSIKNTGSKLTSNDKLMSVLFDVLASDDWVETLNKFTLTADDGSSLFLNYLSDATSAKAYISTKSEALVLGYSFDGDADDSSSFEASANITVNSLKNGSLVGTINNYMSELEKLSSTAEDGNVAFVRLVYDYLFDAISSVSVENILGSGTYAVKFNITGNNSGIESLKGVSVNAEIYVTGGDTKMTEGDLNVVIKRTGEQDIVIDLNVIARRTAGETYFYIDLQQVMQYKLNLKVMATQSSLYETLEELLSVVTDTNVLELIATDSEDTASAVSDSSEETEITDEQISSLADILSNLFNFDLSNAFTASTVDGVTTADLNLDALIGGLGIETDDAFGNVAVTINHNTHAMSTSGKTSEDAKAWITLSSERLTGGDVRDYTTFDTSKYIDITFIPDLLSDVVNTATNDEGEVYDEFTFSGTISANIVSTFDIDIDVSTLTFSLIKDDDGNISDFCFSGIMHVKKMSALGIVTIPESTVGITYQNGYITLARNVNTTTPEYKIMTMEYFLDHMLVKSDSVLQWWLDVDGWSTVIKIINAAASDLDVSSGLTTTKDEYLYKASVTTTEQEISMYDYVSALKVVIGGSETATFGDMSSVEEEFSIYDNYYGFALNADKVTGGVLTKLNAMLLRESGKGITGVKASGAIDSYVTFDVSLDYEEGITEEYSVGTGATLPSSGVTAPSLYTIATDIATANGETIDYDHYEKKPESGYDEQFGCYTVSVSYDDDTSEYSYSFSYDYSNVLYTHELTIVNLDNTTRTIDVRHGSTVYLYDNDSPAYSDDSETYRLLYTRDEDGEDLSETSFVMTEDTTVYAVERLAVNVEMVSGETTYTVTSFVGDKVPTTVAGKETIGEVTISGDVNEDGYITDTNVTVTGVFVESTKTVNDVIYTFDSTTMTYTATGKAAGFNEYYSTNGNTLVLENEIDGYPVTAIAEGAFANTDGYPIKSVIVPSNITTVGASAFADNVGMESAVFLADNVTMGGSSGEGADDNTTPFYGCSTETGGTSTSLTIYYNTVTFENSTTNMYWTKFRRSGSGAIYYRYYVGVDPNTSQWIDYDQNGGGTLYASGSWEYVDYDYTIDGGESGNLTASSVETILSQQYGFVTTNTFTGSTSATEKETAVATALKDLGYTSNGIKYVCNYEVSYGKANGKTVVTYTLSYTKSRVIYVYSDTEFTYYGTTVAANTETTIDVPSTGDFVTPTSADRIFTGWTETEKTDESGNTYTLLTANWRDKKTYTVTIKLEGEGWTNFYVGSTRTVEKEKSYSFTVSVLEGDALSIKLSDDGSILTVGDTKYKAYKYKEVIFIGVQDGDTRTFKFSSISVGTITDGILTVTDNVTVTYTF